jgi:hypothetical protein
MTGIVHDFEIVDSRTFYLPPDNGVQATHLATIKWKLREFIYFRIDSTGQTYIEEVILRPTYKNRRIIAQYRRIDDDTLWNDLAAFLTNKGFTNMKLPYSNPFN